ncbi:MAG: chromosome segregation protein SMC, partial [Clostridia bacterium]|nr:chromosome segregation protein SMC [Clostridia bacterium]
MYLKCLEMQGFKSFPDKTKLTFENGATVIVGPNGSGKSNISDAMRWVLGEISSKSLRGSKMEDVIFGGADSRKPMGFAEVSVTFDNTDEENKLDCPYDEVIVTRRYYRSGESEYFINKRAVRLRDIYELFLNTGIGREGYSIIGQGKIAEIISRKSEDRRNIFEDASGIAKFRHKKNESERKLAATEENMTRVNDIFVEISAQVGPLEKEAEKAKRAIELLETKKKVDVQLWFFDTEKYRRDIAHFENLYKQSSFELSAAEEAIASFEAQIDRLSEISQTNRYESEKLLSQIQEQTGANHKLDSEYKVNENDALHIQALIDSTGDVKDVIYASIENEKAAIEARLEKIKQIKLEGKEALASHEEIGDKIEQLEEEIERFEENIARALDDIRLLESDEMQLKVRLSVIENAKNTDSDKNTSISDEMENYKNIEADLEARRADIEKTIESYNKDIEESDGKINGLSESLEEKTAERAKKETVISEKQLRLAAIEQRIETFKAMDEHFEGYNNSVRFVMKAYSEGKITDKDGMPCKKIYGPVSKLISVDGKYVTAVETSLGASIQNIVVADESVAKAAMLALKRNEAGRATFMPLTSVKASNTTPELKDAATFRGFIAFADDLVAVDAQFTGIVSYMLGRIAVFDNIDNATDMAKALKYKVRAVTLDGQQINVGGSFTGGSVKQSNSILGRAGEIKKLEQEQKQINEALAMLDEERTVLAADVEKLDREIKLLEDRKKMVALMMNSENARLEQLKAKIEANNTLIEKLREDYEGLLRMRERYDEDHAALTGEIKLYEQVDDSGKIIKCGAAYHGFFAASGANHITFEGCELMGRRCFPRPQG